MKVRKYTENDISEMVRIWNIVVEDGVAFPQEEDLTNESGREFFASQTYCGVAEDDNGAVCGMWNAMTFCNTFFLRIHPNIKANKNVNNTLKIAV